MLDQGICVSREYGKYECICHPGFSGEQCEIDIDDCASNPCVRGICYTDMPGRFKCSCPSGKFFKKTKKFMR